MHVDLFSTYFRFRELAGTGSSRANLAAEPARRYTLQQTFAEHLGQAFPSFGIKGGRARR